MVKRVRAHEKKKLLFPADRFATEIASRIDSDLSKVNLFDHTFDSCSLQQLIDRQKADTLKRYQRFDGYDIRSLTQKAFDDFHVVNSYIGNYNTLIANDEYCTSMTWNRSSFDPSIPIERDKTFSIADILFTAKNLVNQVLGKFDDELFHTLVKHGSGTTVGITYSDTSIDRKFIYPISCTEGAKSLFEKHTRCNSTLHSAIQELNGHLAYGDRYDIVDSSRGSTVNKTSIVRRFICVEPTLNMFFQQGMMQMMYVCLRSFGLDVKSLPSLHRRLAYESSITRKNGTIDMKHASDSVSFQLVKRLLPPDWFGMLNDVRTPFMEIDGEKHRINMFSTMGNATTFPLETLVFWSLACSCQHYLECSTSRLVSPKTWSKCSVFGDDCILPTLTCPLFMDVCEKLGFTINKDKSFIDPDGEFRESCGGDYFRGFDVRPYAFKAPRSCGISSLEPWLYTILNNILPKYITCFGCVESVFMHGLGEFILRLFDVYDLSFKFVPADFPDDAGFRVDSRRSLSLLVSDLQALGVRVSPIFYCKESDMLDFAMVKFRYPKQNKQNDYLRYAMLLYRMTDCLPNEEKRTIRRVVKHKHIFMHMIRDFLNIDQAEIDDSISMEERFSFGIRRSPVRKKGGYVLSRVHHRFDDQRLTLSF